MMTSAKLDWNNWKKNLEKIFPSKFYEKSRNFRQIREVNKKLH